MNVQTEFAMPEVDFGQDQISDMPERLMRLSREGKRVVPVRYFGAPAYLVLNYKDVADTFRDEANLPAAAQWNRDFDTAGKTLLHMQGAEHFATKNALMPAFSPGSVRKMAERVLLPTANELIDDFGDRREVELQTDYTQRYGFNIISRILGIPVARDEEDTLRNMIVDLVQHRYQTDPHEVRRQRALAAVARVNEFLRPIIQEHRANPADDLISMILATEVDGRLMTDDEIYTLVRFIYLGGADTVGLSMANVVYTILADEALKADLLAHPEKRAAAIEEALRLNSVTGLMPRFAVHEMTIAGVTVPANTHVLLAVPNANRDPSKFADPTEFIPGRSQQAPLTFGVGAHFCLGVHLAREEMRISVNQLLDRLPGLRLSEKNPGPVDISGTLFRLAPPLYVKFDDIRPA